MKKVRKKKYELWEKTGETCFLSTDHTQYQQSIKGMKKIWSVKASTWGEAMTQLHQHMGWEEYSPME